jgi:hypothetical protein
MRSPKATDLGHDNELAAEAVVLVCIIVVHFGYGYGGVLPEVRHRRDFGLCLDSRHEPASHACDHFMPVHEGDKICLMERSCKRFRQTCRRVRIGENGLPELMKLILPTSFPIFSFTISFNSFLSTWKGTCSSCPFLAKSTSAFASRRRSACSASQSHSTAFCTSTASAAQCSTEALDRASGEMLRLLLLMSEPVLGVKAITGAWTVAGFFSMISPQNGLGGLTGEERKQREAVQRARTIRTKRGTGNEAAKRVIASPTWTGNCRSPERARPPVRSPRGRRWAGTGTACSDGAWAGRAACRRGVIASLTVCACLKYGCGARREQPRQLWAADKKLRPL